MVLKLIKFNFPHSDTRAQFKTRHTITQNINNARKQRDQRRHEKKTQLKLGQDVSHRRTISRLHFPTPEQKLFYV